MGAQVNNFTLFDKGAFITGLFGATKLEQNCNSVTPLYLLVW